MGIQNKAKQREIHTKKQLELEIETKPNSKAERAKLKW